jgi:hypothetical protein
MDGYTLLGSKHFINSFENQPIIYTTGKALMHIVKWVEECVSLSFLEFTIFYFSQQNMLLFVSSYNIEITPHKHSNPIQTK